MTPTPTTDIEHQVIGEVLLEPHRFPQAACDIDCSAFTDHRARLAWGVLAELQAQGEALCEETLVRILAERHSPEKPEGGWPAWVFKHCADNVTSAAMLPLHCRTLREARLLREVHALGRDLPRMFDAVVPGHGDDAVAALRDLEVRIGALSQTGRTSKGGLTAEVMPALTNSVLAGPADGRDDLGTGIPDLNRLIWGWRTGRLYTLAARPGVGKTTCAMQFALNAARAGGRVVFFSLEMTCEELGILMLANEAGVDSLGIESRLLGAEQEDSVRRAGHALSDLAVDLQETPLLTVGLLRSHVSRRTQQWGAPPDLVVIDYLQLMAGQKASRAARHEIVAGISRDLKQAAAHLEVPVLALSQLGRPAAKEQPGLHHLRESGAIEQDSNVVMLLTAASESEGARRFRHLDLNVAKNRHGRVGCVSLAHETAVCRVSPSRGMNASVVEEIPAGGGP